MNVLLEKYDLVPFDKIENSDFIPALKEAINQAKKRISEIKDTAQIPDFTNTIISLEEAQETTDMVSQIFFNLRSANTNDELNQIAKEFSPLVTNFSNDILLDGKLFARIQEVYENKDKLNLGPEEEMTLTKCYRAFTRNGALLKDDQKEELRKIDQQLSDLSLSFSDHVLKDTNDFELLLVSKDDLKGLPESYLETSSQAAEEKGHPGKWLVTLDYPSYQPFMTYAENRNLRKKLYQASGRKGFKGGETDNCEIIKKMTNLRYQRAKLLGFNSHSEFVLQERMAETPKKVMDFLHELIVKARPKAEADLQVLSEFSLKNDGPQKLQAWDSAYYLEKLKQEKFDLNEELLRPYFKLEDVLQGVFSIAGRLYDIKFEKIDNAPVYHQDVQVFKVTGKNQEDIGIFYTDFFPRAGKRNGAWMTTFKDPKADQRPHVSIVCNFSRPTSKTPSLLRFSEVTTLFHEFGHALHALLSKIKYSSISGTNVYWDFVELPSQIMENWAYEKEALDIFAKHFETGEKISEDLIQKIKDSSNFFEASASLRQNSFALLDMAWHQENPQSIDNVETFENEIMAPLQLFPQVEGVNFSTSFSHIFAGGYSSGYYSYKWAEVLDADAFDLFKEKGIFDKKTAADFREHILSKGGSQHPLELYKKFRGRDPSLTPLLKRGGLIS